MISSNVIDTLTNEYSSLYSLINKNKMLFKNYLNSRITDAKSLDAFNKSPKQVVFMDFSNNFINLGDYTFSDEFSYEKYFPMSSSLSYITIERLRDIHAQIILIRQICNITDKYFNCKSKELIANNRAPISCLQGYFVIVKIGDKEAMEIYSTIKKNVSKLNIGLCTFTKDGLVIGTPFETFNGIKIQNMFVDSKNYDLSTYELIFDFYG